MDFFDDEVLTTEQLATKKDISQEYLARTASRNGGNVDKIDSNYVGEKISNRWHFRKKAGFRLWQFVNSAMYGNHGENARESVLDSLKTFRDFNKEYCNYLDIINVGGSNGPILFNILDHIPLVGHSHNYCGDHLLYLICRKLINKGQQNGVALFEKNLSLILAWFLQVNLGCNLNISLTKLQSKQCLYCGKRLILEGKDRERYKDIPVFCKNESKKKSKTSHCNDFYTSQSSMFHILKTFLSSFKKHSKVMKPLNQVAELEGLFEDISEKLFTS